MSFNLTHFHFHFLFVIYFNQMQITKSMLKQCDFVHV